MAMACKTRLSPSPCNHLVAYLKPQPLSLCLVLIACIASTTCGAAALSHANGHPVSIALKATDIKSYNDIEAARRYLNAQRRELVGQLNSRELEYGLPSPNRRASYEPPAVQFSEPALESAREHNYRVVAGHGSRLADLAARYRDLISASAASQLAADSPPVDLDAEYSLDSLADQRGAKDQYYSIDPSDNNNFDDAERFFEGRILNKQSADDLKSYLAGLESLKDDVGRESPVQLDSVQSSKPSEFKRQDNSNNDNKRETGKFTTLLEDVDETSEATIVEPEVRVSSTTAAPEETRQVTTEDKSHKGEQSTAAEARTYTYGKIITDGSTTPSPVVGRLSVMNQMYKKVAAYLPFLSQIDILKHPTEAPTGQNANKTTSSNVTIQQAVVKSGEKRSEMGDSAVELAQVNTKPRVSIHSDNLKAADDASERRADAAINSRGSEIGDSRDQDGSLFSSDSGDDGNQFKTRGPAHAARVDDVNKAFATQPASEFQGEFQLVDQDNGIFNDNNGINGNNEALVNKNGASLLRKSPDQVTMSFGDQPEAATHAHLERLAERFPGKYIYAPTHHYYLNTGGGVSKVHELDNDDDSARRHIKVSSVPIQPSHLRRLHTGDEVFSSYDTMHKQPIYQKDDDNPYMMLKTNDMYFLAMVIAFCAMAMAAVLAAGLFAYRIQQNRKVSSDTDYPTYGVVGPSNLNGKCGAASLVGGYFGGGGGGLASANGSKSGSNKNLPDSASGDSGVGAASDKSSGGKRSVASLDTAGQQVIAGSNRSNYMNNQNAARMYHYQHQKQQMIISDRASTGRHTSASDLDSEDENEEGSYTVYECPGLASAHEMEIKNPLFNDDRTP